MDKPFQDNSGKSSDHPPPNMLLLFVDGELPAKEAAQLEAHLEACWPCRVKTKKLQDTIADIIEFDEQALTPRVSPPNGWDNFQWQLGQLAASSCKQSVGSRLLIALGRFFPVVRLYALPLSTFRPMVRAAAVLIVVLTVVLLILLRSEPRVSANQLLENVVIAQSKQLRSTQDPVVHQKLQVRRKDHSHEKTISWDIWNDTKNSRVRQVLADGSHLNASEDAVTRQGVGNHSKSSENRLPASERDVIDEVARVLGSNHMDPVRPLSADSFKSWRSRLQRYRDEVSEARLADGLEALTLRTIPDGTQNFGRIAEATLVVRARDWQPAELRLNVASENGICTYVLTETVSEIVSLSHVRPGIFDPLPGSPVVSMSPNESVRIGPQASATLASRSTTLPSAPIATADLEVEALLLLNRAGADLGEQISVKRTQAGILQITGIVESEKRKNEISSALGTLALDPRVHIEIQTVTEAVAKEAAARTTRPASVRPVEIAGNAIAAEQDLRSHFSGKGRDIDEAIREYAARMVSHSSRSMDHLWAMKRLLSQFSQEETKSLTTEGRDKWTGLIRAHAHSYHVTSQTMRRELHPVFFAEQPFGEASDGGEIKDTHELARLVDELFELGSANDKVIRSAFTSSSAGVITTVIKAPQFWRALKNAESLALRIGQNAK